MLSRGQRAAPRSRVRVTDSFFVERYSHVMHLVSNVEGDAPEGPGPGGRADGRPARRHPVRRAQGAGHGDHRRAGDREARRRLCRRAWATFRRGGSVDTCIVLRTALFKDGMMYVQAGGGVVADSDPDAEYDETLHKARALEARRRGSLALRLISRTAQGPRLDRAAAVAAAEPAAARVGASNGVGPDRTAQTATIRRRVRDMTDILMCPDKAQGRAGGAHAVPRAPRSPRL